MTGTLPADGADALDARATLPGDTVPRATEPGDRQTLLLHAEQVTVSKQVRRTLVRAARTTATRDEAVAVDLHHEQVVVERVAVGKVVDAVPAIRQDGDVTIVPVVEEELVMVRRLVLKEEVHLRRVRSTTTHTQTVTLREQRVAVTRTALDD